MTRNQTKTSKISAAVRKNLNLVIFALLFASAGTYFLITSFAATPNCTITVSSNIPQAVSSAAAGSTVCLTSGDYGQVTLNSISKTSDVTITAAAGATPQMYLVVGASNHLVFKNLTLKGAYINGDRNTSFIDNTFTDMTRVDTPANITNANVVFDGNTFANINPNPESYEGRLTIRGYNNTSDVGVKIINNKFGPGGYADGVQIVGDAYGVQIGPGNEFFGLVQSNQPNSPHTDPIQLYGSSHTVITGNYIHGNTTGIMAPDGSDTETITNNVIQTTGGYDWPIVMGGAKGNLVSHNTLPAGGDIELDKSNSGTASSNVVIRDNIAGGITNATGGAVSGATVDHNLLPGGGGANLSGTPVYSGGANPASYAGFALANGSPGKGAASDGKDVGVSFSTDSSNCSTTVSTMTAAAVQSALTSAPAGSTICLNSGTYSGTVTLTNISKTNNVTIQSASGREASVDISLYGSNHLVFQNLTMRGFDMAGSSTRDISVLNSTFTNQMSIDTQGMANANVLIDGNTFDGISVCTDCKEGRITIGQYPAGNTPVGVTISNNHFGGAGQSDGIQVGSYGVVIKDNVFDGIIQASGYTRHVDSLQLYGQSHTTITGNYFANFTVAIMAPDGGNTEIIDNNVFISPTNGGSAIQFGHHSNTTFRHNVVKGTDVHSWVGSGDNSPNNHVIMQDNVMINASFVANGCVSCTIDHNLYNLAGEAGGANYVVGTPIFKGGVAPTNYAGYVLADNSPGHNAASDGTDIGIHTTTSGGGGGTTKTGDFNSDGVVNIYDLGIFLSKWQSAIAPEQDLNSDGIVNIYDLGLFLSQYGH